MYYSEHLQKISSIPFVPRSIIWECLFGESCGADKVYTDSVLLSSDIEIINAEAGISYNINVLREESDYSYYYSWDKKKLNKLSFDKLNPLWHGPNMSHLITILRFCHHAAFNCGDNTGNNANKITINQVKPKIKDLLETTGLVIHYLNDDDNDERITLGW